EEQGERRRAALVELGAHDREEDLRREHAEAPAEDDGVAEVRDALDEADEEGMGKPRAHQGQRDARERRPGAGREGLRGLLEGRAHTFHHADQHEEGDGGEREGLREPHARQPVDPPRRRHPEAPLEELVDETGAAEEEDEAEADHERRGDDRPHGEEPERAATKRVRVPTSAKARPRPVVEAAVRSASRSVFHATPHVPPPVRQSTRQIFAVKRRAARALGDSAPPSASTAAERMRTTGKKVKRPTSTATSITEPATKPSPRKAPPAASPAAHRNRKAAQTTRAPIPSPTCRSSRPPNTRPRTGQDQPERPMAKPCPSV